MAHRSSRYPFGDCAQTPPSLRRHETPGSFASGQNTPPADLHSSCAQEPIAIPGYIQPHGALFVAEQASGNAVTAVSENASSLLGLGDTAASLLNRPLGDLLGAGFTAGLAARLADGGLRGPAPWSTTIGSPGAALDASTHLHDGRIIVELEPRRAADAEEALVTARQLQAALADLQDAGRDLTALANVAAAAIRGFTGYERVLIYRFDSAWHGQAIAETKVADWEQSLNGLHFPASDIPAQARALYRRNPLRWTPSRDAKPVPLLRHAADPHPVDLSFARLRAFSPIHLQYHRNMGVDGAMSLSILTDGTDGPQLWGLVVCHHRRPHAPSPGQRMAAAVLTDAFARRVASAEQADTEQARRLDMSRLANIMAQMADAKEVAAALTEGETNIGVLFATTGAAVLYEGTVSRLGDAPPAAALQALAAWLATQPDGLQQFHTDNLGAAYPAWQSHSAIASGVLAVFLSADRSDMLLWFRPEEPQLVTWGGQPHKPEMPGASILPRQSFERWVETRHGVSRPWAEWELEIAESLRHGITDVIIRSLRRITALNEQLRQSQKMEAVGQLTGGLAHDFNNLLTGVIGSLDLVRDRASRGRLDGIDRYLDNAKTSADRAVALTHRLLAFSRRQTLDPKPVDVAQLITTLKELISRSVGPAITVQTNLPASLWNTICDANQLDNALLNLSLNARDAMPDGGHLAIEAANVVLDEAYAGRHHDIAGGEYVAISVTDNGAGMPPDIVARVFEPFFTTKPMGQGTGLGLSMVYGFTKQSNGYTGVYSEPGRGTTVRLYLPRYLGEMPMDLDEPAAGAADARPHETVLLVDDEPVVRMLIAEVLGEAGYHVLEAEDGPAGLAVLRSKQPVHLLVTDVGLPGGLNGRQLADAARVQRPELKVLFITGYAENAALGNGLLEPGMQVMTKPFAMDVLTSRVRAML